jgi:hypothetical protein
MTICPSCQHKNPVGVLFCSECGTLLVNSDARVQTRNIADTTKPGDLPEAPAQKISGWLTLHILPEGHLLPLAERDEFTLGRVSDNQPIVPDIDLSPYQAYSRGVSRLHAVIKRKPDKRITIMDLGSSNGTYLNGRRLAPHAETPLSHGDMISLGKLKIQVLIA